MAKKRTKKDKIIAQLRRQMHSQKIQEVGDTYEYSSSLGNTGKSPKKTERQVIEDSFLSLFSYDPQLITKDLFRTLLLASLAFAIEIGLYFHWK